MTNNLVEVSKERVATPTQVKVSDYIASFLAEHGVQTVFCVTGGGAMHLNDSLSFHSGLDCVFVHHEQSAAMAAEGYARVSERPAVVNVTTGPGAINALNGVFGAFTDSIPMIVISGQVKRETLLAINPVNGLRQLGDQEIDAVAMVRGFTKYAVLVSDPQSIRYHLEKALYLATSGRKGPVWLDIPIDVQASKIDVESLKGFEPEAECVTSGETLVRKCTEVLKRLREAKRPAIMVGTGIRRAGALAAFKRVAHKLGIPVATAWTAIDVLGSDDPVYCGRPGTIGDRPGNFTVQNSDVLLVIGCRLNIRQISYNWESFAREAFKIIVDVDEAELRKPMVLPEMPVHADARAFLEELERQINADAGAVADHSDWLNWCKERVARYPVVRPEQREVNGPYVNPYHFVDCLFDQLLHDDTVVCANGSACVVTFQAAQVKDGQKIFANSGSASMGYDLPASIGAAVALRGERVICLAGDGSLQMNIQELQTIVHHQFPIKIFVFNNNGYLSCRLTQGNFFKRLAGEGPANGISFPDTVKIGNAYGIKPFRIEGPNFEQTLKEALAYDGPVICDVLLDPAQGFEPKLSARQLPDGRIISPALEDLAPFLPPEELEQNLFIPRAKS